MVRKPIGRRQDCSCEQVDSVGEQGKKLADAFNCMCKNYDTKKSTYYSRTRVYVG
jgi:hypothetical protein